MATLIPISSTAQTQNKPTVIVIGGGIVGLSCAYYLAQRGVAVTVIEKDEIGVGASAGNAGLIAVGHPPLPQPGLAWKGLKWMFDPTGPLYIPPRFKPDLIKWLWQFHRACKPTTFRRSMQLLATLGRSTLQCFDDLQIENGTSADTDSSAVPSVHIQRQGQIEVYKTVTMRDHCRHEADLLRTYGFDVEELDTNTLHEREPAYVDDVIGAIILKDSAFAHPQHVMQQLSARAAEVGVTIKANTCADEIVMNGSAFQGVRVKGSNELLEGDTLILAAGAWTTPLAQSIGVPVPMQAAKGYHMDLTAPEVNINMAGVLKETLVAVNPSNNGLRLAGTLEFSGINERIVRKRLEMLETAAKAYIKGVEHTTRIGEWCGLRPCTADGLPVVGWAPQVEGVCIATGHAMLGFALGPATGKLISELILDNKTSLDITPLSPSRFG